MKKRIVCCLLVFTLLMGVPCAVASAAEQEIKQDGFIFVLKDGYAVVKGFDGGSTIPAQVNGLPVTEIADKAFISKANLTEITVADSVTRFGYQAFHGCKNLQKFHYNGIPEKIGMEAFYKTGLSALPENTDEYGNVYAGNILVEINTDENGVSRVRAGTVAVVPDPLGGHFDPNEGWTELKSVKELYFPDGFLYVSDGFANCNSYLEKVVFGKGKLYIDDYAFSECSNLNSITLPDEIQAVGRDCFYGSAYAMNSKNWKNGLLYLGKVLISGGSVKKGSEVTVKSGTTILAASAFGSINVPYTVTLPDSVRWIGSVCFSYSDLVNIKLSKGIEYIGPHAFEGCSQLRTVEFPEGLDEISYGMFTRCGNLLSVDIPASVKRIGDGAIVSPIVIKYRGTLAQLEQIEIGKNNVLDQCWGVVEYKPTCKHAEVQDYVFKESSATATGRVLRICRQCLSVVNTWKLDKKTTVETVFTDIKKSDWFYSSIDYAYNYKLFNGTDPTRFSPNVKMTRGMFVTVLMRLSGNNYSNDVKSGFTDVPKGKYYTGAVRWAMQAGIVNGTGKGKFEPDAPITREQLCKMIILYTSYAGNGVYRGQQAYYFNDDAKISKWAWEYVYMCQAAGLVQGKNGNIFDPQGLATRAEVATILYNLHSKYMLIK